MNEISHLKSLQKQYEDLKQVLATLHEKFTHEIMVPLGEMAFIPGKMIHTNEVLVLLGENYFVWRSNTQAVQIITRRLAYLKERIGVEEAEMKRLEGKVLLSDEIRQAKVEAAREGVVNIVEEYDSDSEREWRRGRRLQEEVSEVVEESEDEDAFLKRLEELEKLEAEAGEAEVEEKPMARTPKAVSSASNSAFSGTIVERNPLDMPSTSVAQPAQPRRVSRFKQQQQQANN